MPQVTDGDGEAVLSMATLRERFANPEELVGHSLYVSVTVLTESGGQGDHGGLGGGIRTAGTCEAMGPVSHGFNVGTQGDGDSSDTWDCGHVSLGTAKDGEEFGDSKDEGRWGWGQ